MTWLVAIVALCVVIILHELGHYLAAVWTGMKVDRFSVFGIGPAIVKLGTWRGTEFVIGAIPFGAYVLIRGMEPEDPQAAAEKRPRPAGSENFRDKPLLSRMLVIAGGPLANYVAAMMLYFGVFASAGMPGPLVAIEVAGVHDGSAAAAAGIHDGDTLVSVGEVAIDPARRGSDVVEAAQSNRGHSTPIVVQRNGELVSLQADLPAEGEALLGIDMRGSAPREAVGLGVAAGEAVQTPLRESGRQLEALYLLVTGQLEASMQGPVGIVKEIARSADAGLVSLITTAAFISTLLGLFNLLPLPALDGGRLCFLFYEGLARRRASPRVEELVHGYGIMALLALIALVTVGDVRRLF